MIGFRRVFTVLVLSTVIAAGGWYGVNALIDNASFARAQQEVEASRAQLKDVQDVAAVFRAVGKVVEPSVVEIEVTKVTRTGPRSPAAQDWLKQFLKEHPGMLPDDLNDDQNDDGNGLQIPDDSPNQVGEGSGVIMEVDGSTAYILTNNHVAGGASKLVITLADGRKIENAKVLGTDPKSDLAVIKVEADRLIPAKWGDSDYLEKGDMILAFGSPFGYVGSMTHGIVSALHRTQVMSRQAYQNFIQVDAPINPGNSGGPLVNLKGEVVGINTAIATHSGGFQGISFAIPSNEAHMVFTALREKGRVVRGFLGVAIQDVADRRDEATALGFTGANGLIIEEDEAGTPAAGKLQPGDIVTQVDGKPVTSTEPFREQIAAMAPGTSVTLDVFRAGKPQKISIKLGEQPEDLEVAANGTTPRHSPGQTSRGADALGLRLSTPSSDQLERYGIEDGTKGAIVTRIEPNSLAANARLKVGDVVTQVGDQPVANEDEADAAISKADLAKGVKLYITDRTGSRFVFVKSEQP
jgi:serine protease Do